MGILNGSGTDVGHGFQRLQIAVAEGIGLRTIKSKNSQCLPKRYQGNAHARRRFRKKLQSGSAAQVAFRGGVAARQNACPGLVARRKAATLRNAWSERSVMCAQHEVVIFA